MRLKEMEASFVCLSECSLSHGTMQDRFVIRALEPVSSRHLFKKEVYDALKSLHRVISRPRRASKSSKIGLTADDMCQFPTGKVVFRRGASPSLSC